VSSFGALRLIEPITLAVGFRAGAVRLPIIDFNTQAPVASPAPLPPSSCPAATRARNWCTANSTRAGSSVANLSPSG
jgi:hypothetical protein